MKKIRIPKIKLKKYFNELEKIEDESFLKICALEKKMQEELKIPEIEFHWCDGCIVGIGTPGCSDMMGLVQRH